MMIDFGVGLSPEGVTQAGSAASGHTVGGLAAGMVQKQVDLQQTGWQQGEPHEQVTESGAEGRLLCKDKFPKI